MVMAKAGMYKPVTIRDQEALEVIHKYAKVHNRRLAEAASVIVTDAANGFFEVKPGDWEMVYKPPERRSLRYSFAQRIIEKGKK